MARVNSQTTRFRLWLVRKLDPMPPSGEVWCMRCALLDGENLVMDYSQMQPHLDRHRMLDDKRHHIEIRGLSLPTSLKG